MVRSTDIEQVFLKLLRDKCDRDKIIKDTGYFDDHHWHGLIGLSIQCDLFPPFYNRLLSLKLENIPPEIIGKLKNLYLINLKKNIILEQELFRVIKHLNQSDIRVIPLKGPVLARLLYNDLALRQTSSDLDLLIHRENAKDVTDKLESIGYCFRGNKSRLKLYYRFSRKVEFFKQKSKSETFALDLHWNFGDRFINTHIKNFWLETKSINLDGYKITVPSYNNLLLYLALTSILDHGFIQIKYIYDIHKLAINFAKEIDWKVLINRSQEIKLDTVLFFSLNLSKKLFHSDIPIQILDALRPALVKGKLCKLCINKDNIFKCREKFAYTYLWRYIIISFLSSKNIFDFLALICKKNAFNGLRLIYKIFNPRVENVSRISALKKS